MLVLLFVMPAINMCRYHEHAYVEGKYNSKNVFSRLPKKWFSAISAKRKKKKHSSCQKVSEFFQKDKDTNLCSNKEYSSISDSSGAEIPNSTGTIQAQSAHQTTTRFPRDAYQAVSSAQQPYTLFSPDNSIPFSYVPQSNSVIQQYSYNPLQPSYSAGIATMPMNFSYNQSAQMAALAMQMQVQAMAMQAQASALMMQIQQQSFSYIPQYSVHSSMISQPMTNMGSSPVPSSTNNISTDFKHQKHMQLMSLVEQLSKNNVYNVERLLLLVDRECDIVESVLSGSSGYLLEKALQEHNNILQRSAPLVVDAYNLVLELATLTDEQSDAILYRYILRKGGEGKVNSASRFRKRFLFQTLKSLEYYYQMIGKMLETFQMITQS